MIVEIEKLLEITSGLDKLTSELEDRREIMNGIYQVVRSATDKRFEDETGPDGKKWPTSLRARLTGGKTLSDNETLKNSITYRYDSDTVEFGTTVKYAAIHQFGGDIVPKKAKSLAFRLANGDFVRTKKVTMPARPYIGVSQDDLDEIGEMIVNKIRSVI